MATVRVSRAAQADFDAVLDELVEAAGNKVAADYAERLRAAVNRLAGFPGIGTPRSDLGPRTRMASVHPFLIFYDGGHKDERIAVLRLLHGRRDITPELIARGREP